MVGRLRNSTSETIEEFQVLTTGYKAEFDKPQVRSSMSSPGAAQMHFTVLAHSFSATRLSIRQTHWIRRLPTHPIFAVLITARRSAGRSSRTGCSFCLR
mgnify:CR=1 FL=1